MDHESVKSAPASTMDAAGAGFSLYTQEQKRAWAKKNATDNAKMLSQFLGYEVNSRLPYVLLQAASDVIRSITDRSKLKTRICRADHYVNTMKVLATAILHYDLAANLVAVRDRATGKLERCENSLFSDKLSMPARTVDNCIYSLKRSGLYLSFEQREEKESADGQLAYRGLASIKRINSVLFEMLGLGGFLSVQRAKAKERAQLRKLSKTPIEQKLDEYKKADDKVREKRNQQRADAAEKRKSTLAQAQANNRTQEILAAIERGEDYHQIKAQYEPPLDDIPY